MPRFKPKVRMTSDGRFRPLLSYGDGVKAYGPRLTFDEALKRAKRAVDDNRRAYFMALGVRADADDRAREYDRKRPLRVFFSDASETFPVYSPEFPHLTPIRQRKTSRFISASNG